MKSFFQALTVTALVISHVNALYLVPPSEIPRKESCMLQRYDRDVTKEAEFSSPGTGQYIAFDGNEIISNPVQTCAASYNWVDSGGAGCSRCGFPNPVIDSRDQQARWQIPIIEDGWFTVMKWYKWFGLFTKGKPKNCPLASTKWLSERSTVCTNVGQGGKDSLRLVIPNGMTKFYDFAYQDGFYRVSLKSISPKTVVSLDCTSPTGNKHVTNGTSVKIRVLATHQCIVGGVEYVSSSNKNLLYREVFYHPSTCYWAKCSGLLIPDPKPFFLMGIGPAYDELRLNQICVQNQNNAAFGGTVEQSC